MIISPFDLECVFWKGKEKPLQTGIHIVKEFLQTKHIHQRSYEDDNESEKVGLKSNCKQWHDVGI